MLEERFDKAQIPLHPRETIKFIIEARGMSTRDFIAESGIDEGFFNESSEYEIGITSEIASILASFFNTSEDSWLKIQKSYETQCADFRKQFEDERDNFEKLDYHFFEELGMVKYVSSAIEKYKQLLYFFKVDLLKHISTTDLNTAFKSSANEEKELLCANAWVKTAQYLADRISVAPYDSNSLESFIFEIRQMTLQPPESFLPRLREIFNRCGVAFVILPTLKNSRVNGAVKWISDSKVLLAINDNGKDADKFWFALFHEIKHILQEKRQQIFVSVEGEPFSLVVDDLENEADNYARNVLIPDASYERFKNAGIFDNNSITAFATEIGIDKGIIVGRLQHDKLLPKGKLNELKTKYKVVNQTKYTA